MFFSTKLTALGRATLLVPPPLKPATFCANRRLAVNNNLTLTNLLLPPKYSQSRRYQFTDVQMANSNELLFFEQYFDTESSTYTYLLGDAEAKEVILIDTVEEHAQRDFNRCKELGFTKIHLLSTHIHADHITGNARLKGMFGNQMAQSVLSKYYPQARADKKVGEEDELISGRFRLKFLHTPGHTAGCVCIVDHMNGRVFTGDTLLIQGCGRTDFQGGSSERLYESVHQKLFTLPRHYSVYPAHDYKGQTSSTIGREMDTNPRLTKTKDEFIEIMSNLKLAYPKKMDIAVPRNLRCGYND